MSKNTGNPDENKRSAKGAVPEPLTATNFADFGLNQLAYIKREKDLDAKSWVLHGADGNALALYDTPEQALRAALEKNMRLVHLH